MVKQPLLSRGGSSSSSSQRLHRSPAFRHRSDAIACGSPYEKAAALIDLVCSFLPCFTPPSLHYTSIPFITVVQACYYKKTEFINIDNNKGCIKKI